MNIFEKLRSVPGSLVHSMTFPKDLHDLHKSIDENDPENSALDSFSLDRKTSTELKMYCFCQHNRL